MNYVEEIKRVILEEIALDRTMDDIPEDFNLIRNGLLDSMGIIKLMLFMEQRLLLKVGIDDLDKTNFQTIERIALLCNVLSQKAGNENGRT